MSREKTYKGQKGFTLVELIVVVALLGIIAAIGVPMYLENLAVAKNVDAQNTLRSIYLMQKDYFARNSCYFVTGTGDQAALINQNLMGATSSADAARGPIPVGAANNPFQFYITVGPLGSSGSCTGINANDYIIYAQLRSDPSRVFTINQSNIKSGF